MKHELELHGIICLFTFEVLLPIDAIYEAKVYHLVHHLRMINLNLFIVHTVGSGHEFQCRNHDLNKYLRCGYTCPAECCCDCIMVMIPGADKTTMMTTSMTTPNVTTAATSPPTTGIWLSFWLLK